MFFGCLPCCGGGGPCECGDYAQTVYCEITASLRDGTFSGLIIPPICQDEISQLVSSSSGRYVLPWAAELGGWSYFVENQAFIYFVAGVNGCSLTQARIRFTGTVPQCFAFVESVTGTNVFEKVSWVAGPFFSAIPENDCSFWQGDADRVFSFAQQNSILLNGSIGNVGGTVDVTVTLSTNPAP